MCHHIEDDIDSHGVGEFFGIVIKEPFADAFFFPTVGQVGIPADEGDHASVGVEVGPVVGGLRFFPADFNFPGAIGV